MADSHGKGGLLCLDGSDNDIARLIQANPRAWRLWLHAYQWGLIAGAEAQRVDDVELAELAARIALANLEVQEDVRHTARLGREWIDVDLAREKRRLANESRTDSCKGRWL